MKKEISCCGHASDCAVHNEPALPAGPCDCSSKDGEVMYDKNVTVMLSISDSNHLRRLLGWVSCEIGQAPEEMINTYSDLAPVIGPDICKEGKVRISEAYLKSKNIPKYIRDAIKALRKKV